MESRHYYTPCSPLLPAIVVVGGCGGGGDSRLCLQKSGNWEAIVGIEGVNFVIEKIISELLKNLLLMAPADCFR